MNLSNINLNKKILDFSIERQYGSMWDTLYRAIEEFSDTHIKNILLSIINNLFIDTMDLEGLKKFDFFFIEKPNILDPNQYKNLLKLLTQTVINGPTKENILNLLKFFDPSASFSEIISYPIYKENTIFDLQNNPEAWIYSENTIGQLDPEFFLFSSGIIYKTSKLHIDNIILRNYLKALLDKVLPANIHIILDFDISDYILKFFTYSGDLIEYNNLSGELKRNNIENIILDIYPINKYKYIIQDNGRYFYELDTFNSTIKNLNILLDLQSFFSTFTLYDKLYIFSDKWDKFIIYTNGDIIERPLPFDNSKRIKLVKPLINNLGFFILTQKPSTQTNVDIYITDIFGNVKNYIPELQTTQILADCRFNFLIPLDFFTILKYNFTNNLNKLIIQDGVIMSNTPINISSIKNIKVYNNKCFLFEGNGPFYIKILDLLNWSIQDISTTTPITQSYSDMEIRNNDIILYDYNTSQICILYDYNTQPINPFIRNIGLKDAKLYDIR